MNEHFRAMPLLAMMSITLAVHKLKELFFQCVVVSVFGFWREIGFGVTYLRTLSTMQLWHCVSFWFWREINLGVTYVLSVQYSCAVVSVFWLWREIVLKMRTPFDFLWEDSTKNLIGGTLLWSASRCVYSVRPNTLLLCIFLFCTFALVPHRSTSWSTNQNIT